MAKCLVTGGAGFIGSHLAERLVREGHSVTILDDLSTGKRENIAPIAPIAPIANELEWIEGDIRDAALLNRICKGKDAIFHHAAVASVSRSLKDPIGTNDVNLAGTLQVLTAARDAGVSRLLFASSCAVYGNSEVLPKVETMPLDPLSPYAIQKASAELYARNFNSLYGLETICFRYFNVFGPRQDPNSEYSAVIPRFVSTLAAGRTPTIFGDGRQSRDFISVESVVEANLLGLSAGKAACGKVYNIGTGMRVTLNELVAVINRVLGTSIAASYAPPRPGDVLHSCADISSARKNLGFNPGVSLEAGLAKTAEWFLKRR